ncbi:membrane-associated protein, putative, partial [Bodo saltans]
MLSQARIFTWLCFFLTIMPLMLSEAIVTLNKVPLSCSSPISLTLSSTAYELQSCRQVALQVTNSLTNVTLLVMNSSVIGGITFAVPNTALTNVEFMFVNSSFGEGASGDLVILSNSMTVDNVTLRWLQSNITLTVAALMPIAMQFMSLVVVSTTMTTTSLSVIVDSCNVKCLSYAPQATANVGRFASAFRNVEIAVTRTTITTFWSLSDTSVLLGYSFDFIGIRVEGGGNGMRVELSKLIVVANGSSNAILFSGTLKIVRNATVRITESFLTLLLHGPRDTIVPDSLPRVSREGCVVMFEVAQNASVIVSDVRASITFDFLNNRDTTGVFAAAMSDQSALSLVRCNGQQVNVTVANSRLDVLVRRGVGGPVGIIVVFGVALVGVLVQSSPAIALQQGSAGIFIVIKNSHVSATSEPLSCCAFSHDTSVAITNPATTITTSVNAVAFSVSALAVSVNTSRAWITLQNCSVMSVPPRLDLCPTGSGIIGGSFPVVLLAANSSVLSAVMLGSSEGFVSKLISKLFSRTPLQTVAANAIRTEATVFHDIQIISSLSNVSVDLRQQPQVIGFDPTSSLVAAHLFIVSGAFSGLTVEVAEFGGIMQLPNEQFVSGPLGAVIQTANFIAGVTTSSISFQRPSTSPASALFFLESVTANAAAACLISASDFDGMESMHLAAVVVLQDTNASMSWVFRNFAWTAYGPSANNAMFLLLPPLAPSFVGGSPLVSVSCVRANGRDVRALNSVVPSTNGNTMFVIRITPCATSPTTFLTRTNFVTATQPHQLSHSGTHSIGIKPTASVDPNATTVALHVLSDRTIVAAIVGTVSWLLPGSHVAASALQRSSLAESFALRCKAISSSETEDAGPLIMSDPLDNPFQVSIGVTGVSPSLNFAMGGLIANIAVCLVWGVAKTIAVFIYGTFYDRTPPSVSLGEVILATFDAYTPLLTACSSGAVAALALHSQSGDLVLGCIMVTVWCAPFIIIVAKLGVQYRGPHFPFDAVLYSPGPDSPSATFRIRWFGERHELVTCPKTRLGSVTLAARDLLGEYRVGRHCFICFELAVSITTGFLVGLGWFSQNCSTYLSAVAAVSVFSTLMALTFPLQVK